MTDFFNEFRVPLDRRSFVKKGLATARAATVATGVLSSLPSFAQELPSEAEEGHGKNLTGVRGHVK